MARSTWSIYKKVGDSFITDGTFYRPNDIFSFIQVSTQSKQKRVDGENTYVTPSTKYIDENFTFVWYYDDGTMKDKIEGYITNQNDIKIVDHNSTAYFGRFISITPNWLVGESPDAYDIQTIFEQMTFSSSSSSSSSSSYNPT